jgi:subtilisin family serine protease
MKRVLIVVVFTAVFFATGTVVPFKTSAQKGDVIHASNPIPNRYIVVLDDNVVGQNAAEPQVESFGQYLSYAYGGEVKETYSSALRGFVVEMTEKQAEAMNLDPSVRSIEEDGFISVSTSQVNAPWHLDRVDQRALPMNSAYSYTTTGAGVHIYIIDTGIRYTHTDFGGRANAVYDNIGDGQNGNDCNGHGTHVAGIAGSSTYGVAKNALIHSVRVLPCSGNGQISNLLAGINWVTANRVLPAVANISITAGGSSPALETGVNNSIAAGVTYTIAAGNQALDACGYTPARVPNALTIGATSDTDARAPYSNYGSCVDLFAPGHSITSLSFANDTDTRVLSGTSMAAPTIAGAAALYLSINPLANPSTVANFIRSSATTGIVTNIDATSPNLLLYTSSASPTAANVTVSGRVTNSSGRALSKIRVTITGEDGSYLTITTNNLGYYSFAEVATGQTYVVTASSKRYQFSPRMISLMDEIYNLDFIALE